MDEVLFSWEEVEDLLLTVTETLSERAVEKFVDGELSQQEYCEVNELLRQWSVTGAKLLEFVS